MIMVALNFLYPTDLMIGLFSVIVGAAAALSAAAFTVTLCLRRRPALRHSVLLSGLVACLATPLLVGVYVASRASWIRVPLISETVGIASLSEVSEEGRPGNQLSSTRSEETRLTAA